MKNQIKSLIFRCMVNAAGLWAASKLLNGFSYDGGASNLLIAGLILAIVNSTMKPVLTILSLPLIILSFGLFFIVINAITVLITSILFNGIEVETFSSAILAGMIVGLLNYMVNRLIQRNE